LSFSYSTDTPRADERRDMARYLSSLDNVMDFTMYATFKQWFVKLNYGIDDFD